MWLLVQRCGESVAVHGYKSKLDAKKACIAVIIGWNEYIPAELKDLLNQNNYDEAIELFNDNQRGNNVSFDVEELEMGESLKDFPTVPDDEPTLEEINVTD